jgi:hypothetical protein
VAEGAVSGSISGLRVRGRLHLGVAEPSAARLEAIASFGQPLFIFVTTDGQATLLLTRPDRVLRHDSPRDVLEAITGVPLDGAELLAALTGCAETARTGDARRLPPTASLENAEWRVIPDAARDLYLHRDGADAPWRLVATVHRMDRQGEWRVEYRDFENGFPQTIRFANPDRDRLDLRIALSQVERNTPLGGEVFEIRVPPGAQSITLDELRRDGPLGRADGS